MKNEKNCSETLVQQLTDDVNSDIHCNYTLGESIIINLFYFVMQTKTQKQIKAKNKGKRFLLLFVFVFFFILGGGGVVLHTLYVSV